ncbi:DcaP family trimeric outer membrane transporter [Pararhodonellum marinum]|uniref:DcaP family trimeric outer membrane transporter n=1 Tax=Pararhodonellum marinum TaxID=2755358 RepID=UPI0018906E30|nr:DcaP family trimeric outer membrane transporter [Pararhodonellum marinum]
MMKEYLRFCTLFFVMLSLSVLGFAQQNFEKKSWFNIYGFGRTNFVWDNQDMGRSDLFVPANIKVGQPRNPNFFIGAKQTRIGFDFHQPVGDEELFIKLEGDFHNDATDATGIFRMRHALVKYKFVLIGMEWSNFFDIEANPTTVDFEGPNSSTLSRTPQIVFATYKSKNILSISFENPIEKITLGGNVTALPERFPDVIASYRVNGQFGFIKAAGLFREVRYQSDESRSLYGYGGTVLGSVKIGNVDKLKFQTVIGTGIARYIQGIINLNYDAIYNGSPEMESLFIRGSNISFQHFWKSHIHSSITGGWLDVVGNPNLQSTDYKKGYYGSVNLFWDPVPNLTFGLEALAGERVNIDRQKGSALRTQMNATYKFNYSNQ